MGGNALVKSYVKIMMENFIIFQTMLNNEFKNNNLDMSGVLNKLASQLDLIATHNKMLETQISQVEQKQASSFVHAGTFSEQPMKSSLACEYCQFMEQK